MVRAIFVSQSEEDYSRVFDIFDTDQGGGIDPFEFKSLAALLGDHSTETEVTAVTIVTAVTAVAAVTAVTAVTAWRPLAGDGGEGRVTGEYTLQAATRFTCTL